MMKLTSQKNKKQGQSLLEFVTVTMFILMAFFVFQKYIARGMAGRWRGIGTALGDGKIYDPKHSHRCAWDYKYLNVWYDADCYDRKCEGNCLRVTATAVGCTACITGCSVTAQCDL